MGSGRIVVTGVAGLLGRAVADALASEGCAVLGLDRKAPERFGSPFAQDDLSDVEGLARRFAGADSVVHCAAIARLGDAPEPEIFANNASTTLNVLLAAEKGGLKRVVYASSQSALGLAYAPQVIAPDYLPVDEDHPARPLEAYGLSKLVGEHACEMVARRSGVTCAALRFPVIWSEDAFAANTSRRLDNPAQAAKSQWAYVDLRDAARACALAADAELAQRFRVFNIAAAWPFERADSEIARWYGEATAKRAGWAPGAAAFSSARARAELGFAAVWRWTKGGVTRGV